MDRWAAYLARYIAKNIVAALSPRCEVQLAHAIGRAEPVGVHVDETRVQAMPAVLDELRGHPRVATPKCDGMSATFVRVDGELHCCSRNQSVFDDGKSFYWHVARSLKIDELLARHEHLAIHGEIMGPGIQKNPMVWVKRPALLQHLRHRPCRLLQRRRAACSCAAERLEPVPLVGGGDAFEETVTSLLTMAEGLYEARTTSGRGS